MEIRPRWRRWRALPGPLHVMSDSTYVVNCFRDRWWASWQRNGWRNSKKQPVANRDLWEPLVDLVNERGDVTFGWVKGHGSDPMNNLVDAMAVEEARLAAADDRRFLSAPQARRPSARCRASSDVRHRRRRTQHGRRRRVTPRRARA